jgi:hypothetical protein
MKILKSYLINTLIAVVFFGPVAIYTHITGGRSWSLDDTIAILMLGWLFGALIKALFLTGKVTTKEAAETINSLKNKR